MRLLIFGGRDFQPEQKHRELVEYLMADFLDYPKDITVVTGCAKGADSWGEEWGRNMGTKIDRFPADWEKHGKSAGMIRNQEMLDSGIDYAIMFPGGRGTADMRRRLDKAGVTVWEVKE